MDEEHTEETAAAAPIEEVVHDVEAAVEHTEETIADVTEAGADVPADLMREMHAATIETRDAVKQLSATLLDAGEHASEAVEETGEAAAEATVEAPEAVANEGAAVEQGVVSKFNHIFG